MEAHNSGMIEFSQHREFQFSHLRDERVDDAKNVGNRSGNGGAKGGLEAERTRMSGGQSDMFLQCDVRGENLEIARECASKRIGDHL